MDLISMLIILGAAFGISLWVSRPLNNPHPELENTPPALEDPLQGEYQRLLGALQELDFDHAQDKLAEADYAAQRAGLLQSAAELLKQMEEHKQPGK